MWYSTGLAFDILGLMPNGWNGTNGKIDSEVEAIAKVDDDVNGKSIE